VHGVETEDDVVTGTGEVEIQQTVAYASLATNQVEGRPAGANGSDLAIP
jgi:hypothetical protein